MKIRFSDYFNPLSKKFNAVKESQSLSPGKRFLVGIATFFATVVTLPFLGIGGLAMFRWTVNRFKSKELSPEAKKVDDLAKPRLSPPPKTPPLPSTQPSKEVMQALKDNGHADGFDFMMKNTDLEVRLQERFAKSPTIFVPGAMDSDSLHAFEINESTLKGKNWVFIPVVHKQHITAVAIDLKNKEMLRYNSKGDTPLNPVELALQKKFGIEKVATNQKKDQEDGWSCGFWVERFFSDLTELSPPKDALRLPLTFEHLGEHLATHHQLLLEQEKMIPTGWDITETTLPPGNKERAHRLAFYLKNALSDSIKPQDKRFALEFVFGMLVKTPALKDDLVEAVGNQLTPTQIAFLKESALRIESKRRVVDDFFQSFAIEEAEPVLAEDYDLDFYDSYEESADEVGAVSTNMKAYWEVQQSLSEVDSSKLVTLEGGTFKSREDFLNNPHWQTDPALWAYDQELVPEMIVSRLISKKRDSAIAVKYLPKSHITDMEGALHTFVNPVGKIHMLGDVLWRGAKEGKKGSLFGNNQARPVILSATVLMDFELKDRVLFEIAALSSTPKKGKALPDDFEAPDLEEKWEGKEGEVRRKEYDAALKAHMIHHLSAGHELPAASSVRAISLGEGIKKLEELIANGASADQLPPYIKVGDMILATEVVFNILWRQVKNEFDVLEASLTKGYVYTFNPPSIFYNGFGKDSDNIRQLFARLQTLAIRKYNEEVGFYHLKVFGYSTFKDEKSIEWLQKVLSVPVVARDALFMDSKDNVKYPPDTLDASLKNELEGTALVIHNNSDAFGQNIETEGASSLDGVIGVYSDAACVLKRERDDHIYYPTGAYE